MGERQINPLFNVHDKYKEVNIINPYRFGSAAEPSVNLKLDLLGCWEFEEQTGTVVNDSNGNYPGTNYGADINQDAGLLSKSYYFDSITDRVTVANIGITVPTNISASIWFRCAISLTEIARIFEKYGTSDKSLFTCWIDYTGANAGKLTFALRDAGSHIYSLITPLTYNDDLWHLVTIVKEDKTMLLYMDGDLISSFTNAAFTTFSFPSNILTIIGGYKNTNYQLNFKGYISQVGFWNRVLAQEDVTALFGNGYGKAFTNW